MQVYYNPKCSKCRELSSYLKERNVDFEEILYLDNRPTKEALKEVLAKLGKKPIDIIRASENIYKQEFKGKELTDEQWIEAMVKYPNLIQRPIVIDGDKAVVARPANEVDSLL